MKSKGKKKSQSVVMLKNLFKTHGRIRKPNLKLQKKVGSTTYKKGYEVRLITKNKTEARLVSKALREVGLKAGSFYANHTRFIVPVYGQSAVEWFTGKSPDKR